MVADLALAGVAAVAGVALSRLVVGGTTAEVLLPVVGTALAAHAGSAFGFRHPRVPAVVAIGVGVIAAFVVAIWTVHPGAGVTVFGPFQWSAHTFTGTTDAVRQGLATVARTPTPVPARHGVVLVVAVSAGLVAVVARSTWAWSLRESRRSGRTSADGQLVALVPAALVFGYTTVVSGGSIRLAAAVMMLAAVLLFAVAADGLTRAIATPPVERPSTPVRHRPTPHASFAGRRLGGGLAIGGMAVIVVVFLGPVFAGMHATLFLHSTVPPPLARSDEPQALHPRTPPTVAPTPSPVTRVAPMPPSVSVPAGASAAGQVPSAPQGSRSNTPARHRTPGVRHGDLYLWWFSVLGLVAAAAASVWWLRYRRSRRSFDDGDAVVAAWAAATAALGRVDLGRRTSETPAEHAARLSSLPVGAALPFLDVLGAYGDLAGLAGRALYASDPCGPADALHAGQLANAVRRALRTRAVRAELRAVGGAGWRLSRDPRASSRSGPMHTARQ